MLKKLWLLFCQATVVILAFYFITEVLRPSWLPTSVQKPLFTTGERDGASTYSEAVNVAMPAVVNIFTSKKNAGLPKHPFFEDPEIRKFFGEDFEQQFMDEEESSSLGSGVIVNPDGYIITNQHVVESADSIEVSLSDGRTAVAKIIGTDPETDLAVLKIELSNLPTLQFAPDGEVKIGDVVLAIGNPFGVGQTVTMGIVSALGRNKVGINTFENFIQTDAAINPGNSGGALIDTNGNLLGINTAIYSRSGGSLGIGFSIPGNTVQGVMAQIIRTGAVTRGYIGVEQQNITPELAQAFNLSQNDGVIVAGIVKDGPADKAGLKVGDIMVSLDGQRIRDTTQVLNQIAGYSPGETKSVELLREGKPVEITIEIGRRPKPADLIRR